MSKKALILGSGPFGGTIARKILGFPSLDQLILGDLDTVAVKQLAETLAKETKKTIRSETVDATDIGRLKSVIKGIDLVINATGPYDITALPTVQAAIESGSDYIDLNVYFDSTKQVLEFDKRAQDANVRILTGFGDTPGLANCLAKYAANQLDEVDEVHVATGGSRGRGWTANYIRDVWDQIFADPAVVYKEGAFVEIPACSNEEDMVLPYVKEPIKVVSVRSTLVATIPRYIQGVKYVEAKYGHSPSSQWNEVFTVFRNWGLFSSQPIDVKGQKVVPKNFATAFMASAVHEDAIGVDKVHPYQVGGTLIKVIGKKQGKVATYMYRTGAYGNTVGVCTQAAEMLLKGDLKLKGVLAPEALDPVPFITGALSRGTLIYETIERPLTSV
jgi:saccharopine dehydrogenase (NAD+, L-lysine-forming)